MAPEPLAAAGTAAPTAKNLEATATPQSVPSVAAMEKVAMRGLDMEVLIPGRIAVA